MSQSTLMSHFKETVASVFFYLMLDSNSASYPARSSVHPLTLRRLFPLLERLIREHIALGHTPFFVNATAGTTVLGAFDPIRPCGEIAQKYNCWLHVDGSWGGAVVFVPELAKTLLDGSELVSFFFGDCNCLYGRCKWKSV
jgi:hypothetical protein